MDKKNIDILLKKAYQVFSKQIDHKTIRKIIPIAFPVLQSTWLIKIIANESSGLIDRYILHILRDFGPCQIKRIDELLCLGEERIEHALIEMERLGSPVIHSGNEYSFAADGDIEHFHVEREHEFSFCINGISGDLLPIDFCSKMKKAEIKDLGEEHSLYIKLSPLINGLESKLLTLQSGTDANKFEEGIPDGFMCLAENNPRQEYCRYYLSFAVVTTDGNVLVYWAGDESISINLIQNYLVKIPEMRRILEKTDTLVLKSTDLTVEQEGTTVYVKVQDQTLWNCFSTDDLLSQSIYFMIDFIRNGWLWDITNWKFSHYILLPGDTETAKALFIRKACFELEHVYFKLDTRQDAEQWLQEFFASANKSTINCPSLDDIITLLLKSSNSEVHDFARMMISHIPKNPAFFKFNKIFYNSTESTWKNCIIDFINTAKSSIQIISPVIESEQIFHVLSEANQRGVYLQIITSLLDRNGKIKTSGDKQFSLLKLPGQKLAALGASVRATKNVPHAKIVVIDKSIVLFMSANLNDNSLGTGNTNALETCILLHNSSIIDSFIHLFDDIWDSAQYVQATDRNSIFIAQNNGKPLTNIPSTVEEDNQCLIFSCPQNLALEKTIIKIINEAKHQVILIAMSFYDMEQVHDLYDTILDLLSKNIAITLLVRTGIEQFSESEWPDESTNRLVDAGLQIIEIPHLHAKGVIVDEHLVLAMSANFNPFSLGNTPTSHIECGLLTNSNTPWARDFISFAKDLIKA